MRCVFLAAIMAACSVAHAESIVRTDFDFEDIDNVADYDFHVVSDDVRFHWWGQPELGTLGRVEWTMRADGSGAVKFSGNGVELDDSAFTRRERERMFGRAPVYEFIHEFGYGSDDATPATVTVDGVDYHGWAFLVLQFHEQNRGVGNVAFQTDNITWRGRGWFENDEGHVFRFEFGRWLILDVAAVPEPSGLLMGGMAALFGIGWTRKRRLSHRER